MSNQYARAIVNPAAGGHSTCRKWPRISKRLIDKGLSFDSVYTEGIGHAIELARAAANTDYRYIIAVGGDGTVNEVVNGILSSTGSHNTILGIVSTRDRKTLHNFIKAHTAPDTEAIYTDDWLAYHGIADHDTRHETVNHSAEEWVRGDVHTNTVENVWSLFKRSVIGSYHKLSTKHLDAYLDELEWRFNNRDNPYLFRDTLLKLLQSDNLPYEKLTGN